MFKITSCLTIYFIYARFIFFYNFYNIFNFIVIEYKSITVFDKLILVNLKINVTSNKINQTSKYRINLIG
jgi:hypothetical protein